MFIILNFRKKGKNKKKKLDDSINFLRGQEKIVFLFYLRLCEKVEVNLDFNKAGSILKKCFCKDGPVVVERYGSERVE